MKKQDKVLTYQEMYDILINECNFTEKMAKGLCDYYAELKLIEKENKQ